MKFWDKAIGFIEGDIFYYLLYVKWTNFKVYNIYKI